MVLTIFVTLNQAVAQYTILLFLEQTYFGQKMIKVCIMQRWSNTSLADTRKDEDGFAYTVKLVIEGKIIHMFAQLKT